MQKQNLTIKYLPVEDLIPYARNSRTHSPEQVAQLASSIKEFGFTNPILVDAEKGVIAGHGRLMGAQKLGLKEVPTIEVTGWSDAQKRAYIIADNKLALNAGWDEELLKLEFEELKEFGEVDLELTGFELDEIDEILGIDELDNVEEDEVPEPPVEPKTKPGDLWIMGGHRLLCGDSTKSEDIERLTPAESVDLWITDPPYNVAYEGGTEDKLTIQNDSMDDASFLQFLSDAFSMAYGAMKPGASFYIWHADSEGKNFRTACEINELKVRQCLIWVKNSMVMGRQDYQWKHEPCLYGWKGGASHNWYSDRKQTTVLEFNKPLRNGEHPTMKPVDLFAYQIGNSSKKGDIVLDSFGGSGTTLVACEQMGRKARLMELDPKYCDVIVNRWQELTGLEAVREDGVKFNDL